AQLYLADLNNADEVAAMAEQQTEQIDKKILWASLYGASGDALVDSVKISLDFVATDRVNKLLEEATAFLYNLPQKPAAAATIRPEALQFQFAEEILKERGLTAPVGEVRARPASAFTE